MDTMVALNNKAPARTGAETAWDASLYAACQLLHASAGEMVSALSVTVPRTNRPDNLAEVELFCTCLAAQSDLDIAVAAQERGITVSFNRRTSSVDE